MPHSSLSVPRSLRPSLAVTLLALLLVLLVAGCGTPKLAPGPAIPEPTAVPTRSPTATPWQDASFPNRPFVLIVPDKEGSDSDAVARSFAAFVAQTNALPQPLSVENRPEEGGAPALAALAARRGDPYSFAIVGPELFAVLPGETEPPDYERFTPLGNLGFRDYVLLVSSDAPHADALALLNAAKAASGALKIGILAGDPTEAACVATLLPVAGGRLQPEALGTRDELQQALLDRRIEGAILSVKDAADLAKSGKIRPVGLFNSNGIEQLPGVPTLAQLGLDGFCASALGFVAPGGIAENAAHSLEAVLRLYTKNIAFRDITQERALTQGWMDRQQFEQGLSSLAALHRSGLMYGNPGQ